MGKTPDHVESLVHENDRERLDVAQLLVGGLEHFYFFPYIGNNHPN